MALGAGRDELVVDAVDVPGRLAEERDRHSVPAGGRRPARIERPDGLLRVEHEAEPAGKRRLRVAVPLGIRILRKLEAEATVEVDRPLQVGHDHPDGVQARHGAIIAREQARGARKESAARAVLGIEDQMPALDAISSELTELETEEERVFSWRHGSLLAAGYEHRLAFKLALRPEVDLHLAVRLRRSGCPPETAARILL